MAEEVAVEIDKRELILDAASEVFVREGLQVRVSEIAHAAGVATVSLYNYFRSKDELVAALYRRIAEEHVGAVVRPIDRTIPHRERLLAYFYYYIDFIWADPVRAQLLEYLSNTPVISVSEAMEIFRPFIDYGKSLVLEGQRDGAIRDFPGDLLNSFLRGSIRNTLKRLRGKNGSLTPKLRRQLAELCWSTIANGQEPAAGHLAARRPPL